MMFRSVQDPAKRHATRARHRPVRCPLGNRSRGLRCSQVPPVRSLIRAEPDASATKHAEPASPLEAPAAQLFSVNNDGAVKEDEAGKEDAPGDSETRAVVPDAGANGTAAPAAAPAPAAAQAEDQPPPSESSGEENGADPLPEDAPLEEESGAPQPQEADTPAAVAPDAHPEVNPALTPNQVPVKWSEFPHKTGDEVVGRVLYSYIKGARIQVIGCPGVIGFMPKDQGPLTIPQAGVRDTLGHFIQAGAERRFAIMSVPPDMALGGKGPLLSAAFIDRDVLWQRLKTAYNQCRADRSTVRVTAVFALKQGLKVDFMGSQGFIPASHIIKPDSKWVSHEDMKGMLGQQLEVAFIELNSNLRTFKCSMTVAAHDKLIRHLKIGSLVWGVVRSIMPYGVFLTIDGTQESALLHITNVSWARVDSVDEHFTLGDRVRAVIIGMDEGAKRISLSTRDIEGQKGDMLTDKEAVYASAEENVQRFLDHVADWERREGIQQ